MKLTAKQKQALRREKKAAAAAAAPAPNLNAALAEEGVVLSCSVCYSKFTTRNKLFQHIKKTGHAVVVAPAGGKGGKASGKR